MLSQREHEFLDDLTTFRDDFRRAGGVRALHTTEEHYVRSKLDDKYGSRYVLVLRNRIRRHVSTTLEDLLEVVMVDADDPTAGRSGPRSLLPHELEGTLEEIISKIQRRCNFQPSASHSRA